MDQRTCRLVVATSDADPVGKLSLGDLTIHDDDSDGRSDVVLKEGRALAVAASAIRRARRCLRGRRFPSHSLRQSSREDA